MRTPSTPSGLPALALLVMALTVGCESKKVPEPTPAAAAPTERTTPAGSASDAQTSAPVGSASPSSAVAPTSGLPAGPPRFSWRAPLSVAVEEDVDQGGQRMQFAYRLDVCPADAGTFQVSHRGVTVTKINGASTQGKEKTLEMRQIEAAAAALPTMVIDRSGNFLRGTGYAEMIKQATTAFPGDEFADLRRFLASGQAPSILDVTLAQLWQAWVGVWLAFDPARGMTQEATERDAGPAASHIALTYGGQTPDQHARFAAHRVPTREEVVKLAGATGAVNGAHADADQSVVLDWSTETDWPDVRPYRVRSRRSATMVSQGKEQTVAEEHEYRFDWRASDASKPRCVVPGPAHSTR